VVLQSTGVSPTHKQKLALSHRIVITFARTVTVCASLAKANFTYALGQEDKVELMPLLREHRNDDTPLIEAIINSMKVKPKGHDFDLQRAAPAVVRFMSHTGG
jgi:GTP cyclohydrolase subunit MoaA